MASSPDAVNLQDVRALAERLYAQCRDSPSSYKLLTTPVRKLRNVLDEAEEIFDETRTLGPDDLRVLEQANKSRGILQQLDLAFQSYRSSNYVNVNESAIADFKTHLDVTTRELELAFEAITTGEIPLKIDTSNLPYGTGMSKLPRRGPSSSSNATDSAHERKSSCTSSAWSLVPKTAFSQDSTSDSISVRSEDKTERNLSDEKQPYDFEGMHARASPATGSAAEVTPSFDWRSPFGSPDPLSFSFEEASAMIMAEDEEELSSAMRSRSGTGSTLFVDVSKQDGQAEVGLGLTPSVTATEPMSTSTSTATLQPIAQPDAPIEYSDPQILPSKVTEGAASPTKRDRSTSPQIDEIGRVRALSLTHSVQDESGHLSPASAATEFARKKRNYSITSITEANIGNHSPVEQNEGTQTDQESSPEMETNTSPSGAESTTLPPATVEQPESSTEDLHRSNTMALERVHQQISAKPIPPWPAFDVGVKDEKNVQEAVKAPPAMPKRQPPPPPPKPRRSSGRARTSSYRIVNASPIDSQSSEDELYTISKPSSPTAPTRTAPPVITHTIIPKVSIDASACEEDAGKGFAAFVNDGKSTSDVENRSPSDQQSGMSILASALRSKFSLREPSMSAFVESDTNPLEAQPHPSKSDSPTNRRHSIAVSPSQDTSKNDAPALPPRPSPPPVPKRPPKQRYRRPSQNQNIRPAPSTIQTSPAIVHHGENSVVAEKELSPESGLEVEPPGLEVQDKLDVAALPHQLRQRISVDAALDVEANTLLAQTNGGSQETTRHLRSASTSQIESASSHPDSSLAGFYGPGIDSTTTTELEKERINHIIHFWNSSQWDQAEAYLTDYLAALIEEDALARVRRVRHLLGVCASFKGEWLRAIPLFLSTMRTPIRGRDIVDIDDGDCAAAYWLGDCYSLLNKRTEALLAYCIAERSSLFSDPTNPALSELISSEQEAVQLGAPKTEYSARCAQAFSASPVDSILDPNVVTTGAAMMLFEMGPRKIPKTGPGSQAFTLTQSRARSHSLFNLSNNPRAVRFHRMIINSGHFEPDTPWPMMYDPLFAMANVHKGRLLQYETDLLAVFKTNLDAKIPRSGPLGLTRVDCFTYSDLTWLIQTLRECLKMLEMEFSEVANVEGTWFVARYTFMQNKIATTYYFSIALFKQTLRSGYGVDICPDGICSARIGQTNIDYDKGVHVSESKRIKKLVREYLDEAAKQRPKSRRKEAASGTEGTPPLLPPRPNM